MIRFFEILSFLLAWGYTAVFFLILKAFLPLRKNVVLKVTAFLVCGYLADSIIYSNDAGSLFGTMFLFFLYVLKNNLNFTSMNTYAAIPSISEIVIPKSKE